MAIMASKRHGSLFSGIGGFDLAAEWMGWENVFHCEWNEFGQRVLKHYWPNAISYEDITKTDFTIHRGRIDILTGGFPCQPYSMAGKRLGKEDERHLWPEMLRAIREIQPTWVVGENVFGLVNWSGGLVFHEVQADLEAEGYEVQPYVLPACAVNAPHRRDRIWFVAYSKSARNRKFKSENQRGQDRLHYNYGKKGSTPNPNRNTTGTSGESRSTKGNGSNINVQPSEWRSKTELNNRPSSVSRPTPHPNGNGQHRCNGNDEEQPSKRGLDAQRDTLPGNGDGDAADTGLRRMDGYWGESERKQLQATKFNENNSQRFRRMDWDQFPTQSPICSRNDGLSARLDSITFSKWRNESIKAGGNAIVPQVVYQIFKAIEQYDPSPLSGTIHQ
jgi:DNA (cytosine-5)-methyltransferase 1